MVKLKDAAHAAGKEESAIGKRLIPVLLVPVLMFILSACQTGTDTGSQAPVPSNAEITLAQSVLTPVQTDAEQPEKEAPADEKRRPVTVTISHNETGMAAQALQEMIASFNRDNQAGITVKVFSGGQAAEGADATAETDEGTALLPAEADMVILDADTFPHAADSCVALDDLIAAGFDNYEDIPAPLREQAVLAGATRGIPLDAEGRVLFYNSDLFEDLELSAPDTGSALEQCAQTLMEAREMPLLCTDDPAGLFELFLRLNGTEMIAGNRAVFDNTEGRKAMRMILPMLEQDHLVYCRDGRSASVAFLERGAAAYIGSHTDLARLRDADFTVGCAPVFRMDTEAVPVRARMLAITASDADRQAGCFAFMRYLTGTDINAKWAVAAGRLPVRNSAYRSVMFTGYTDYDDAAKAASGMTGAFYVPAECDDYTGGIIRSLLEDYAARGVMSEEACRALAEELNTVLSAE